MRGEKLRTENRRKAGHEFFLSKFHIELKGQVFDRNQWNLWTFASLGIFSLHVPCTSMAWKSVALPYDFQMRYRSTGHLTTYDIFRYFYRFSDRMRPCDIGGRSMGLSPPWCAPAPTISIQPHGQQARPRPCPGADELRVLEYLGTNSTRVHAVGRSCQY